MKRFNEILRSLDASLRLVIINVAVLITVATVSFATSLGGHQVNMATMALDLPSGDGVIGRPWALVTYMFTHTDVWHCVFNMLWLYWFGRLYEQFTSGRRTTLLYLAGGLGGAVFFIAASFIRPLSVVGMLEGASAAVMAIVAATACTAPNLRLNLLFLGHVKIKWVALVTLGVFALGLTGSGAASHVAHIGGIAVGVIWSLVARLRRPRYDKMPVRAITDAEARAELDSLLDKVRRSGYASLSSAERRRLIDLSQKV